VDDRRAKLERLREQGIDPFPHEFDGVVPVAEVHLPSLRQVPSYSASSRVPLPEPPVR
jgi:hypothetical protein